MEFTHSQPPCSLPCQWSLRTISLLPLSFLWTRTSCMPRESQTSVQTGPVSLGPNSNPFIFLVIALLLGKALPRPTHLSLPIPQPDSPQLAYCCILPIDQSCPACPFWPRASWAAIRSISTPASAAFNCCQTYFSTALLR